MGIARKDGYSATVEGFFVYNGTRVRLAKTDHETVYFAEPCELPPGIQGELLFIVDGSESRKPVRLPEGTVADQSFASYETVAIP
jgi:hypothetical protein